LFICSVIRMWDWKYTPSAGCSDSNPDINPTGWTRVYIFSRFSKHTSIRTD